MVTRTDAPTSSLPGWYFGCAHVSLVLACVTLLVQPTLPGPYFFHPRMVAVVHGLTLGWIAGSILGAYYIVAPLALRIALPVGRHDQLAAGGFWLGASGVVSHAWMGRYDGLAWSAALVLWPVALLSWRTVRGWRTSAAPWPVLLHVVLGFLNMLGAGAYGAVIAWDRSVGHLPFSPLQMAMAHAHLAAVGWAVMFVVGLGYRLIPMVLPGAMPTGASLAISAVAIESGLVLVVWGITSPNAGLAWGAGLIVVGLGAFVAQVRRVVRTRLPRPPALPRRDWSTWQTHVALVWMLVAIVCGVSLALGAAGHQAATVQWVYGGAGLLGFLAQIIVGMQGRLVPMYAWYRAWSEAPGPPPAVAANALPRAEGALPVLLTWSAGVPLLLWGLALTRPWAIRSGAAVLVIGVVLNAVYLRGMFTRARRPASVPTV
ncbi:MAG: hypothetical protein AB7L71_04445 [Vicinamibacterales bacterium]